MKKITLITIAAMGWVGVASAGVIYDATPANSTIVSNNAAATGSLAGSAGALVLSNTGGTFGMVGFASTDTINTMNGTALTAADTVTFSGTVTGITGGIRANGVEFGMSPSASFRPNDNLIYALKAQAATSVIQANAFQDGGVGTGKSYESHIKNGFDYTLTANAAGYTFTINDIRYSSDPSETTIVQSGTFAGNEFLDNFGTGHFYLAVQKYNSAATDTVMSISEAQISVIPEPASLGLVAAFGGGIMFIRRRLK